MKIEKSEKTALALFLISLFIRVLAEVITIDGKTGFIIPKYKALSIILSVFSLAVGAFAVFFMGKVVKYTAKGVTPDIFLTAVSFAVAIFSVIDGFVTENADKYKAWMVSLVGIIGILNAIFFFAYALAELFNIKIPKWLFTVPLLYSIVHLIRFFAITTSITIITDNTFSLLFYCACVFFMLEFSNVANAVGGKTSLQRMRVTGYSAAALSFLDAMPRLIKILADRSAVLHENIISNVLSLLIGIFILLLTYNVFDKKQDSANNN